MTAIAALSLRSTTTVGIATAEAVLGQRAGGQTSSSIRL
jgi:hypothetical protein